MINTNIHRGEMSEQSYAVTVVIKAKKGSAKPHDEREAVKIVKAVLEHANAFEVLDATVAGVVKS